jgi:ribosomal-protein-alanine N-acetyltransferase
VGRDVPPGGDARPTTFRRWSGGSPAGPARGSGDAVRDRGRRRFAGQVTVNNIVRGSASSPRSATGSTRSTPAAGVMPLAVAMVIDHCFFAAGLHRIEVAIRPENSNSLRVVEKLGIREVGYAPRSCTSTAPGATTGSTRSRVEECPGGLLARLEAGFEPSSHTSDFATHLWTCAPSCASAPNLRLVDLSGLIFVALAWPGPST